ncbi:MAG: phospholipase [Flavobacteriaceae bacterium]|nr:phospholipase [Flavobacteriaceae bacterium]|tara:strand:+ start:10550 stop:11350 length:801 start_codon:yes stop_codon:yes gene_type:complete
MELSKRIADKKVGLVLSGGGVKGVAHIGVIEALLQRDIQPSVVSGVSAGAIVGALYANNIPTQEMVAFFKQTPLFKYNHITINKPGLFDTEKYAIFFETYFPKNTFEALQKPLYVVATNLLLGTATFFHTGTLVRAVLASAALPPVFSPVIIDGTPHADGGIMNNFPIEPLQDTCDYIIGSYTTAMKEVTPAMVKNSLQLTQRTNTLMLHANAMQKLHLPNMLFTPKNLDSIWVLDKKGIEKAYTLGYDYANAFLDDLTAQEPGVL